jgi:hypothetical protein
MSVRVNFAAWFAIAAGAGCEGPAGFMGIGGAPDDMIRIGSQAVFSAITRPGQSDSRVIFAHAFYPG